MKPRLIAAAIALMIFAGQAAGQTARKPEFTVRYKAGFITEGPSLTGGVRLNEKYTVGLLLGNGKTYVDAAPGNINTFETSLYARRYFHLQGKDIVAFYCDLSLGAGWIYKVTGNREELNGRPGDVRLMAALQPGVRFRIYRNLHIFLGPTVSTDCIGLHLGIGL